MKKYKYVLSAVVAAALYVIIVWQSFNDAVRSSLIMRTYYAAIYLLVAAAWFTLAALCVRKCDKLIKPFIASIAQGAVGAGIFFFRGIYGINHLYSVSLLSFCFFSGLALMIFGGVLLIVTAVIFFMRSRKASALLLYIKKYKYVLSAVVAAALYVIIIWYIFNTIGAMGWSSIMIILDAAIYLLVAAAWFTLAALCVRKYDKLIKPFIASLAQGAVGAGLFIFAVFYSVNHQDSVALLLFCFYGGIALMIFGGVLLVVTAVVFFIRLIKSKKTPALLPAEES